ncbi:MAG: hypothetical protein J6P83_07295 [Bacteroidales bacterium]|nr:hypothetical protein [Bacteroidales bacterium]
MNPIKVEQNAVDEVRACFDDCDRILAGVQTNDKTIAWDGHLYLFNDSSCRKDSFYAKIPVQVKGVSCLEKHPDNINYSIDIADLKAYKDDGIAFFVVYINKRIKTVYYVLLAPIEIKAILSTCSEQNSKSVSLKKLDCSNSNELDLLFRVFYDDCKRQKSVVDQPILSFENLKDLGNPKLTIYGFTSSELANIPRALAKKDAFVYANIENGTINYLYPVGTSRCAIAITQECKKPVCIGGKKYYDSYSLTNKREGDVVAIGKCLFITMLDNDVQNLHVKADFDVTRYNLSEAINALGFLLALSSNKHLSIGSCDLNMDQEKGSGVDMLAGLSDLQGLQTRLVKLKKALDVLHVKDDLDLKLLKKDSDRLIDVLIAAFVENKDVIEKQNVGFITEIGLCNINILVLAAKTGKNTYHLYDFFNCPFDLHGSYGDDKVFPITPYAILDKDKILKYSNIDYSDILSSFKAIMNNNPKCFHIANTVGLYLLLAYDEQPTKNEILIKTAKEVFDWLYEVEDDELSKLSSRLNVLQIKKRLGPLGDSEKEELYEIAENTESDDVKFAAYLLFDEQTHAMRFFNKLNGDVQSFYRTLPIFHFVKE